MDTRCRKNCQVVLGRSRSTFAVAWPVQDRDVETSTCADLAPTPVSGRARVGLGEQGAGYRLVEVVGALDIAYQQELTDVLSCAVDSGAAAVIVDLSAVTVLAAAGFNCLAEAADRLAARGGRLHLVCPAASPVARVLRLLDPDGRQPRHTDITAAALAVTRPGVTARTADRAGDTDTATDPELRPADTAALRHPAQRHGYEHLVPLFAERAGLPDGHPEGARLRRELIAGYLPVARNIARRFGRRGEIPDDLEQVAALGLVLAVDRFEPGRGVDFLSFAVPTITGEVQRYFRDRFTPIRLPRRLRQLQAQIYDAAAELAQRHGRAARPSEIARHLGVDVEVVLEGLAAQNAAYTSSLDEPRDSEGGGSAGQGRLAGALGQVEPEFDLIEYRETLGPLLAALPERERQILLLRFFGGLTQTEIGARIGISQMHVSRLLTRTLAQLRRQMTTDEAVVEP